ncbi:MAG TPA: SDR family NAD(P)-dependent oxidoreductase [Candidatus Rifleibacterium sp.]|jgi:NAD(P)-dependent dehydrogenase (short-subunit alcohol dehydrogenase family)|nr:SDR family NAD(P)-dependent oxidoreductase [Candidatus Rifleibacterium sp.]
MKRLQDRVAFITGGGSGIGRAIAERFAAEGARVAISGRRTDKLADTVNAIQKAGGHARAYALDVRDVAAIDRVVAEVARDHGGLDVLVNNAGISGPTPVESVTYERWRDILTTNLDGAYFCARAALRHMKDHADARVINIATIGAAVPFPGWTAYCASKSGLVGVTRCLAMEVAPRGITVNAILPGWVESDMQDAGVKYIASAMGKSVDDAMPIILSQVPLGRMSQPEEIAALAAHIASREGRGMTGSSTVVSNGAFMN